MVSITLTASAPAPARPTPTRPTPTAAEAATAVALMLAFSTASTESPPSPAITPDGSKGVSSSGSGSTRVAFSKYACTLLLIVFLARLIPTDAATPTKPAPTDSEAVPTVASISDSSIALTEIPAAWTIAAPSM